MTPTFHRPILFLAALCLCAVVAVSRAEPGKIFYERAESQFQQAQTNYLADEKNSTNALAFCRACFDLAELATNETQRAAVSRLGVAAGQKLLATEPKSAAAHYYLAMNFGELAQAEAPSLAAYKLVHEVEREFKTAADLDVRLDHAGPARNLGALYFQAPPWPLSVGSKKKAHEWFQRAADLAPDYPENQINLAEYFIKMHERAEAEHAFKNLESAWHRSETNLTGEVWEKWWDEWRGRREQIRADFKKIFKSAPEQKP